MNEMIPVEGVTYTAYGILSHFHIWAWYATFNRYI